MAIINTVLKGSGSAKKYGADIASFLGEVDSNGILQAANEPTDLVFSGVQNVGAINSTTGVLNRRFQYTSNIQSVSFPDLVSLSYYNACASMFYGCTSLTSADLSSLASISGDYPCNSMFYNCKNLTNVDLSSLTEIQGNSPCGSMFYGCENLRNVSFPKLVSIPANIAHINNRMFGMCTKLQSVSFGGLKSTTFANYKGQLQSLFDETTGSQVSGGCTVHFPSNFDPNNPNKTFDIASLIGYATFGGSMYYIHLAYDLPATE